MTLAPWPGYERLFFSPEGVVGLNLYVTSCISRFSIYFRGQIRASLLNQDVQEKKIIMNFNFSREYDC
jgi:hypothetical protein